MTPRSKTNNSRNRVLKAGKQRFLAAIHTWAAKQGLRLAGDFVECGTYKGGTANVVCDYLELHTRDKRFWLYDVFDWSPQDKHVHFEGLNAGLHASVVQRFSAMPYMHIVQGYVPASFS